MPLLQRVLLPLLAAGAVLLAGCGDKEDIIEPVDLPDYEAAVKIDRLWTRRIGDGAEVFGLRLAPAPTGAAVFAVDQEGLVVALDRRDGDTLWKRRTGLPLGAGPAAAYNQVFIGSREGELLALSAETGATLWQAQLSGEVLAPPALDAELLVVRASDGKVSAFDRASGAPRWDYEGVLPALTLRAASRPLLFPDAVLVGFPSGILAALARDSGRLLWERRVAEPSGKSELDRLVDVAGDPVVDGERLFAATYQGRVVAFDLRTGTLLWQQPVSTFRRLAAGGGLLLVVDADSRLLALRAADGVQAWKSELLLGRQLTGATISGDYLYTGDFEGWLHVLNLADGTILGRRRIDGDGIAVEPVVDDGTVFVQGRGGKLAALQVKPRDTRRAIRDSDDES